MNKSEKNKSNIFFSPKTFDVLFSKARYKVLYGGRGSGKTTAVADYLIMKAIESKKLILATREYKVDTRDSLHRTIKSRIEALGLDSFFYIEQRTIRSVCGSEFIFRGMHHNIEEIKSTADIDILWVEEAEQVAEEVWRIATLTVRKPDSEILITFNPMDENSPTYKRFVKNPTTNTKNALINYYDNPFFEQTALKEEMEWYKKNDYDAYINIWEGEPAKISEAQIFKGKISVEEFDEKDFKIDRFFYGIDWGFSTDPVVLIRSFLNERKLYIDYSIYGYNIELNKLFELFYAVPDFKNNLIYADNSRPETISFMNNIGLSIKGAKKWAGSVKDGIEWLKSFEKIIIHPRNKNFIDESKLYCYKTDNKTGEILPIIVDKHNHGWDALRYAYSEYIVQNDFFMTSI